MRDFEVFDQLEDLRKKMEAVDRTKAWRSALIRIERQSGEINIDLEYDRDGRWAISFRNSDARAKELAPSPRS